MSPAIPASPHGDHFTELVVVRHGQTEWNVSSTIQVGSWSCVIHFLLFFLYFYPSDRGSEILFMSEQGRVDQELNETGRQQAAMVCYTLWDHEFMTWGCNLALYVILILFQTLKVALRLSQEAKPAAVYSSDLKRADETAQMIAAASSVSDVWILWNNLNYY